MSYGVNLVDQWRRTASYIDKILKGADPGVLPIQHRTNFEVVINLKTAKAIGLEIPAPTLAQAAEVLQVLGPLMAPGGKSWHRNTMGSDRRVNCRGSHITGKMITAGASAAITCTATERTSTSTSTIAGLSCAGRARPAAPRIFDEPGSVRRILLDSSATARLRAQFESEQRLETPIKPWTVLPVAAPNPVIDAFDGSTVSDDVSVSGFVIDGAIYAKDCHTRTGPYPYCRHMRHQQLLPNDVGGRTVTAQPSRRSSPQGPSLISPAPTRLIE